VSQHVPGRLDKNNNVGSGEGLLNTVVTAVQVAQSCCRIASDAHIV
jgi:hypothetical protein